MGFNEIKPIETADRYLDLAIRQAKKKTEGFKLKSRVATRLNKVRTLESVKITSIKQYLASRMDRIIKTFPRVEELNPFYLALVECTLTKSALKKELAKVNQSRNNIETVFWQCLRGIKTAMSMGEMKKAENEFYGRISSVVKAPDYKFLEKARRVLQSFPKIRENLKKIAIAGFPNVGKTTLLSKLSGSTPEIADYAFTTKGIMVGYLGKNVQLLDTPGTLNRFDKMNWIEQQAFLAMKLVADEIIYVFDLTESYPIEDQVILYEKIKEFGKPVLIYLSKTDILPKEIVEEFSKRYKAVTDAKELKEIISSCSQ